MSIDASVRIISLLRTYLFARLLLLHIDVWEKFVKMTQKHLIPLEEDYDLPEVNTAGMFLLSLAHSCTLCPNLGVIVESVFISYSYKTIFFFRFDHYLSSGDDIFISMATYRDENCPNTLVDAFEKVCNCIDIHILTILSHYLIFMFILSFLMPFFSIPASHDQADHPEKLYIGLVEQNCYSNCRTGVLKDLSIRDAPPDVDCVKSTSF